MTLRTGELVHQVYAVVQAAGGVNEDDIGLLGHGALHGVESHAAGSASMGWLHNIGPGTLGPW